MKGRRSIQQLAAQRAAEVAAKHSIDVENRTANLERRKSTPGFANLSTNITAAYLVDTVDLLAWWRLSETTAFPSSTGTVADWGVDQSGNARHLDAVRDADFDSEAAYPSPTLGVLPSALYPGEADDGGVTFNKHWFQTASGSDQDMGFRCPGFQPGEFCDSGGFTLSCFIQWHPYDAGDGDDITIYDNPAYHAEWAGSPILSSWYRGFAASPPSRGWRLGINAFTGKLYYRTDNDDPATNTSYAYTTPFSLAPYTWYHFAVTLEKLAANSYRRKIYINMAAVVDVTGTAAEVGATGDAGGNTFTIGCGYFNDIWKILTRCSVDEVAIWQGPLTETQLLTVYNARTYNPEDYWISYQVPTSALAEGSVLGSAIAAGAITPDKIYSSTRSVTAATTIRDSDSVILASGTFTVTLPDADEMTGSIFTIKNVGAGTISLDSGSIIDGSGTAIPITANGAIEVVSDGQAWYRTDVSTLGVVSDSNVGFTDITTGNATRLKHGFVRKLSDDPTTYFDGEGAWTIPRRWEIVMADGVTAPPVPLTNEDEDDWLYALSATP